jgi:hypothetical protein
MSKPRAAQAGPGILPLPAPLVAHHEEVLAGPKREWIARGQVTPVLLITGLEGVGKREISYHLSQWILCERNGFGGGGRDEDASTGDLFGGNPAAPAARSADRPVQPCGECASCVRALHSTWVDFTEILPEAEEDERGTLKVEQFRDLRSKMGFGAHEGSVKITLIPDAEKMTPQAANSMLKLLEEPPRGWVFLLTASDPTLLLPTIVSRCQTIRLRPMPGRTILALLDEAGVPAERRPIAAELAQGSWGKALELSLEEHWDRRASIFQFLDDPAANLTPLVEWASQTPRQLELLLSQLEHVLSELMLWSASEQPLAGYRWKNVDGARALASHATKAAGARGGLSGARRFWSERAIRVGEIRRQALSPLNRKILAQDLLMPWLAL